MSYIDWHITVTPISALTQALISQDLLPGHPMTLTLLRGIRLSLENSRSLF